MEGIPPYTELLKYIDLQVCNGVDDSREDRKRLASTAGKKCRGKPSYTATASDGKSVGCVACKRDNHVLAGCSFFFSWVRIFKKDERSQGKRVVHDMLETRALCEELPLESDL